MSNRLSIKTGIYFIFFFQLVIAIIIVAYYLMYQFTDINLPWKHNILVISVIALMLIVSISLSAFLLTIKKLNKSEIENEILIDKLRRKRKLIKQLERNEQAIHHNFSQAFYSIKQVALLLKNTTIVDCNDAALTFFQYTLKKHLLGNHIDEYIIGQEKNENSSDKFRDIVKIVSQQGIAKTELYIKTENNNNYWCKVLFFKTSCKSNKLFYTVFSSITREISQQAKHEKRYANLSAVINYIPVAILIVDNRSNLLVYNQLLKCVFQLPEQCKSLQEFCQHIKKQYAIVGKHQKADNSGQLIIEDIINSNASEQIEIVFQDKQTEKKKCVLVHVKPYLSKNKIIVTSVAFIDIGYLREENKKLRTEHALLQILMDTIPDSIYFKDNRSRFTHINNAQAKLLGIKHPENAIGKTDFDYFNREHAQIAFDDERKILETGKPLTDRIEYLKGGDGNYRWVSATKIAIRDENNEITGVVGISRDITERINYQKALKEAKEKAEESDRLKTAFLTNMSHEIRTPLNAIVGFSQLIKQQDLTTKKRNAFINYIIKAADSLLQLISSIIDISKIESNQLIINHSKVILNEVIDELYHIYHNDEKIKLTKNLRLKIDIPDKDANIAIISDKQRLLQVYSHLLSNAIKFTHTGTITYGYTLLENKKIKFFVRDTGIGIPKHKTEFIFKSFTKLENNNEILYGGTGLGLTIAKSIVELLDGEIYVDSIVNERTEFYFILRPETVKSNEKKHNGNEQNAKSLPQNTDWHDKIILIAEDEITNYVFLEEVLHHTGVKTKWAKTGREAIEIFKTSPIDLVLLDIKMTDIDGIEAVKNMKKIKPNIPVIAQTAYSMFDEREQILAAGCNDYIAKPMKPKKLLQLIAKYIEN